LDVERGWCLTSIYFGCGEGETFVGIRLVGEIIGIRLVGAIIGIRLVGGNHVYRGNLTNNCCFI
jgi:hypothetical protein